jgi:hypothetical protein
MHQTPGKPSPHERELGHVTRFVGALSVGVGCVTDKTGTLTENQLTVVRVWTPDLELDVERAGSSRSGVSGDRRGGCSRPR